MVFFYLDFMLEEVSFSYLFLMKIMDRLTRINWYRSVTILTNLLFVSWSTFWKTFYLSLSELKMKVERYIKK